MQKLVQGYRPYLLLTLLCALLYLPGQASMPAMDRDEARYMQATRQMAETDDYVVVRFQDDLRAKKPVGIYWLQSAAVQVFSDPQQTALWPYRLPSMLAALAAVLLTFRFAATLFDRRVALLSAGVMATCLMLSVEAHLAKTDAVLLALTTLVQGSLGLLYLQSRGGPVAPAWVPLAFWLGLGGAILVKGPVTPAITLLTVLSLWVADRRLGFIASLRPVMGLIVAAAVVAPWFIAVSEATDGAFIEEAVTGDLLPKLMGGQESHGAPPGYFILLATLTLWPASLFLWPAVWRSWKERSLPGLRFALAWAVPAWIMFELVPTKLPHYTLPLYPALAMMIAAALFAVRDGTYEMLARLPAKLWYGFWSVIGLAMAGGFVAAPIVYGSGLSAWAILAGLGAAAAVALAWWNIARRRFLNAMVGAMAGASIVYISVYGGVMGTLDDLWVSRRVADIAAAVAPGAPVAATGYHEPSLVFMLGTDTRLISDGGAAAAFLQAEPNGLVAVADPDVERFRQAAADLPLRDLGVVEGFNYSRGDPVALHLFMRQDG